MRVVFFGTYDTHRPRFRILKGGLISAGVTVIECHASIWGGLEDRSHLRGVRGLMRPCLSWWRALPGLLRRYRRLPAHDALVVTYLGQADALVARRLARVRGVPLLFDPYVSLLETVVHDRGLARSGSLTARLMRGLDHAAFRASDAVLVDTATHGRLMRELGLPVPVAYVVPVGAEADLFAPSPLRPRGEEATVLFYGSMIPLHGVETIVGAAAALKDAGSVRFVVVGTGQDYAKARALAQRTGADRIIEWKEHVPYVELPRLIAASDICLGIFGTSRKAQAVIPNKVFQAIAVGRPVITADTPAIREWFTDGADCLLVPPGDEVRLAEAIRLVAGDRALQEHLAAGGRRLFTAWFDPSAIGRKAREAFEAVVGASPRGDEGREEQRG